MLDWIFKYKVRVPGAPKPKPTPAEASAEAASAAAKLPGPAAKTLAAAKKPAPTAPAVDWEARLQGALADDAALLALAQTAGVPLQTKLAAVAALSSEERIKEAERAFRNHDRRVHSLAKQRAQGLRAQREARAEATRLIEAAQALAAADLIPVNSAVELDRAWSALDEALLEPAQREAFAALTVQLSALTRQRADQEAALKRWAQDSRQALQHLHQACHDAASAEQPPSVLEEALARAAALAEAAPAGATAAAGWVPLQDAVALAQDLQGRLLLLEQVLMGRAAPEPATADQAAPEPVAPEPAVAEPVATEQAAAEPVATEQAVAEPVAPEPATAEAAPEQPADAAPTAPALPLEPEPRSPPARAPATPLQQWQQLPPLSDSRLAGLLEARLQAWQSAQQDERQRQRTERRSLAKEQQRQQRGERNEALQAALEAALAAAEDCLAQGLVAETHKHLLAIDELLQAGAPAEALRARIDRLQGGYAELRGWQHWAGGRARDDLAQEAVALAARCAPGPDGAAPKLQLKLHAEQIDSLRARWKELDRLGGATSRALWQRFDAALKTAYEPLAVQKAALAAVREQNLAARLQLLQALEGVAPPQADAGGAPAGLRDALAAMDRFRVEWRKLGPLEHTVPHRERERLAERMNQALQRLQPALDAGLGSAREQRQALITRAQALAAAAQAHAQSLGEASGRSGVPASDPIHELRSLQAAWQQCAKSLPLPRAEEGAMWADFRAALDTVMGAREAVFNAHEAELAAHATERLALIETLEAMVQGATEPTPRALADIDTQWQRGGPAPRAQAVALDARFRQARAAAQQWLTGSRQRQWQAGCDALLAKLRLCELLEDGAPAEDQAERLAQDWAALPPAPEPWETALRQRAGLAGSTAKASPPPGGLDLDAMLLRVEAGWSLPSAPEFAGARRELQLQAMKAALETRPAGRGADKGPTTPEQWLAAALQQPGGTPAQRARLAAVLVALRQRGSS